MPTVRWSRSDKIALIATTIAVLGVVASFFVPEIRHFIGVPNSTEATMALPAPPTITSAVPPPSQQYSSSGESAARNYANAWIGEIKQSDLAQSFPVIVRFPPVLDYGYIVRATYPTLGCEAKWKLVGVNFLQKFTFESKMTRGRCAAGTVVLKFINNEEISFAWHDGHGRTASGSLQPQ
jgi:hypothetical protein